MPFHLPNVYDSDTILSLQKIPRSLCIIGAGVIGSEYATLFAALGIRVLLLDGSDHFLANLDRELSDNLLNQMMKLGISVMLHQKVAKVEADSESPNNGLSITLGDGADFKVDAVLVAAGRSGNTQGLGLERVGITPTSRGHIEVNEHYQTVVPNIYAAGDVVGFPALASTSMEQARIGMCHAFDFRYPQRVSTQLPFCIYTIPEVCGIGETEETCKSKGIAYEVGRARYTENARGEIIGDDSGMIKLVFAKDTLRLLGVHVMGERASEIIHIGQACMHFGGTIEYFIAATFNYPTLAETYKYAAYDGLGRIARARGNRSV